MALFITQRRVFGSGRSAIGSNKASSMGGSKRGPRSGSVNFNNTFMDITLFALQRKNGVIVPRTKNSSHYPWKEDAPYTRTNAISL